MALPTDRFYVPATAGEIRDDFLVDVRLEARKFADESQVDRITRPGTDWHILATAVGNLGILQYSNIQKADINSNLLTATGESLDEIRASFGLAEISPAPATGSVVVTIPASGATANFNNDQLVLPNGRRAQVDGVHISVPDQGEVPVITIDKGSDCNAEAGTVVRFVSPPINVRSEAKVSTNDPLTGGADEETDERKRDRILNRLRNIPAGGNWGFVVETSLNALATVQYAFVYPALGGPGSTKVALVKDIDPDQYDFSRALSAQATSIVRNALHANMPDEMEIVVSSVIEQQTNVAISAVLPNAVTAGGNGFGWLDATPWPQSFGGPVLINAVSNGGKTIDILTASTAPIAGQTHIAWWSRVDQAFYVRLIVSFVVIGGGYRITFDEALTDHNNATAQVGEYISPAAVNSTQYGKTWQTSMRRTGPGESTTDVNRLPRALRRPFATEDWYPSLSVKQLNEMSSAHSEISDLSWLYRSATSPTTATPTTGPYILVPGHFGIYKQ